MSKFLYDFIENNHNEYDILYQMENHADKTHFQYVSDDQDNVFFMAIKKHKLKVVKAMLDLWENDNSLFNLNQQDLLGNHVLHVAAQQNNVDFLFLMVQFEQNNPGEIEWNLFNNENEHFLHLFLEDMSVINFSFFDYLLKHTHGLNFEQQADYDVNPLEVVMESVLNSDGNIEAIYPFFESLFKYHQQHEIDFHSSIDWDLNLFLLTASLTQEGSLELMDLLIEHKDLMNIKHIDNHNHNILSRCESVAMAEKVLALPECQDESFIKQGIMYCNNQATQSYLSSFLEKMNLESQMKTHSSQSTKNKL